MKAEADEGDEDGIKLIEPGEDAAKSLEPLNNRSISLRFLYMARLYCQGGKRFASVGTAGM